MMRTRPFLASMVDPTGICLSSGKGTNLLAPGGLTRTLPETGATSTFWAKTGCGAVAGGGLPGGGGDAAAGPAAGGGAGCGKTALLSALTGPTPATVAVSRQTSAW